MPAGTSGELVAASTPDHAAAARGSQPGPTAGRVGMRELGGRTGGQPCTAPSEVATTGIARTWREVSCSSAETSDSSTPSRHSGKPARYQRRSRTGPSLQVMTTTPNGHVVRLFPMAGRTSTMLARDAASAGKPGDRAGHPVGREVDAAEARVTGSRRAMTRSRVDASSTTDHGGFP